MTRMNPSVTPAEAAQCISGRNVAGRELGELHLLGAQQLV